MCCVDSQTAMASTSRENHVYLAKLAEQAERYEGIHQSLSSQSSPLPRHSSPLYIVVY
jgi:hypothetical protein